MNVKKIGRVRQTTLKSANLRRKVVVDVYLPPGYRSRFWRHYPVVVFNDGQDLPTMSMYEILEQAYRDGLPPAVIVGLHAADRMQEYGTIGRPDYMQRGSQATAYAQFIRNEFWPWLLRQYRILPDASEHTIAGFSLGGLNAFDLAWHHADIFQNVGVFSGALWWRFKRFNPNQPDANRIVHTYVEASPSIPFLKCWFQAGTADETEDRNNNGIIDAIDDTLQLIDLLHKKGFGPEQLEYLEIEGGIHHPSTWAEAMPAFLRWTLHQRAK